MNIGKDCRHPKYICDKCGNEINFIYRKGFSDLNNYCKRTKQNTGYTKDFDLCGSCEKKLREWLQQKEIPTANELIDSFPRWER